MNNIEKFIAEAKENPGFTRLSARNIKNSEQVVLTDEGLCLLGYYGTPIDYSTDPAHIAAFKSLFNEDFKKEIDEKVRAVIEKIKSYAHKIPLQNAPELGYNGALVDAIQIIKSHFNIEE